MTQGQLAALLLKAVEKEKAALAKIDRAAVALQAKNPKLSYAAAYAKAIDGMPAAYQEYLDSRGVQKRASGVKI